MKKLKQKPSRSWTASSPSLLKSLFLPLAFLACLASSLFGAPPPEGFRFDQPAACKVNPAAFPGKTAQLKAAPFFGAPLQATTAQVLVIRVDFSDRVMSKSQAQTESFYESMKRFFHENSYGLLTVSATVTSSVYRLPLALSSYAQGICSNYDQLAKDSLTAADADYNLLTGAPGGSRFHHIMIYHAGFGAETTGDSGCQTDNLWSVFAPTVAATAAQTDGIRTPFGADGAFFNGATVVPESQANGIDPLGVICHEYGHQLGLPDLYRNPSSSVVGKWSLMDSGVYLGSPLGSNPAHLDAWSKLYLGFARPQTVTPTESGTSAFLDFAASSANAFIRIPVSAQEYFLIERRGGSALTGKTYDDALPFGGAGQGFLIWHVDDAIASSETRLAANNVNSGSPYFGVDLVEADGAGAITASLSRDSDPFPGSKGKTLFAAPQSNSFGGAQTGASVSDFLSSTLLVKKAYASESLEITKVVSFPNPSGPGYPQKAGAPAGTLATLVMNASRPASEIKLTLHDSAGRLIRKVNSALIRANGNATSNSKFVYEYDWDGKDDNGGSVPAGVYLYRFNTDGADHQAGKLVLIR